IQTIHVNDLDKAAPVKSYEVELEEVQVKEELLPRKPLEEVTAAVQAPHISAPPVMAAPAPTSPAQPAAEPKPVKSGGFFAAIASVVSEFFKPAGGDERGNQGVEGEGPEEGRRERDGRSSQS